MKKIDVHHHLVEEKGYVDNLLREMDKLKIEKLGLIGMGAMFKGLFVKGEHDGSCADDDTVEKIFRRYPDRFFGLGYIRPGKDDHRKVTEFHERGFKGLKFHIPKRRYDDEEYFPIYDKAQELGLSCLFHTGIVNMPHPVPEERIASYKMDAVYLEAVAQVFPDLKIIVAHLGVQNYLTVLIMLRLLPNVYADMSGTTPGWRAHVPEEDWKMHLWFPQAQEKLLFGTDVHYHEFEQTVQLYDKIGSLAGWGEAEKKKMFYENAKKVYNL